MFLKEKKTGWKKKWKVDKKGRAKEW